MRYSDDPDLEKYIEKTIAARMDHIISDPLLAKIYEKFGGAIFRRSSVFHGLRKFLEDNDIRGDTCLEIGSWNGITAAVLSKRFRKVISIDIVDNPIKYDIARHFGLKIDFKHLPENEKARAVGSLKFDFAFLDGDHAKHTRSDFDMVKHCGRVLFHEYWPWQPPVVQLVNSLGKFKTGGACFALWTA